MAIILQYCSAVGRFVEDLCHDTGEGVEAMAYSCGASAKKIAHVVGDIFLEACEWAEWGLERGGSCGALAGIGLGGGFAFTIGLNQIAGSTAVMAVARLVTYVLVGGFVGAVYIGVIGAVATAVLCLGIGAAIAIHRQLAGRATPLLSEK